MHWLLLAAAFAANPAPEKPDRVFKPDLVYATVEGVKVQLDFAAPKTGGPYPCVVCLHGGAWKSGSRKDLSEPLTWGDFGTNGKSLLDMLCEHGYAGASVGYRLAPKNKFPAQIQDVKTAIRYLKANAKTLNIDPERIGIIGYSAGGHLAALAATASDVVDFEGDLYREQNSKVKCVVDFFGPADLLLYTESPGLEKAFFVPLLGGPSSEKSELYTKASPISHITKDDPPFLIFHGNADFIVPMVHSERLHKKLVETGVKSELVTVSGKGHGWFGEDMAKSSRQAEKFFQEYLKSPK